MPMTNRPSEPRPGVTVTPGQIVAKYMKTAPSRQDGGMKPQMRIA